MALTLRPLKFVIKSKADPHEPTLNIFKNSDVPDLENPYEVDTDHKLRRYSIAGDSTFRQKLAKQIYQKHSQLAKDNSQHIQPEEELTQRVKTNSMEMPSNLSTLYYGEEIKNRLIQTSGLKTKLNSSMMSRLTKHEKLSLTRESRNMSRFEDQEAFWKKNNPRHASLMQRATKKLIATPNPSQLELIHNNPTNFWQLSLRNNDKKILKHVQGAPLDIVKFEELLQTKKGIKIIESLVPNLDIERVKNSDPNEFVVEARSKFDKELNCSLQTTMSVPISQEKSPEYLNQVLKADWNRASLARKNANMLPKIVMRV